MDADLEQTKKLVEAARAGAREAYEELFALHRSELERELDRQLRGHAPRGIDASDIVQEALVDAVRGFDSFRERGKGSFRRWLASILKNRLRMALRSAAAQKREHGREVRFSGSQTGPQEIAQQSGTTSPSTLLARAEERERLERALEQLPEDMRAAIRLVRLEGLSLSEVALRLQRSESAVQKLLARAALKLRLDLGEESAS